ncbi:MAG: hypothetical protein A3G66_04535 [Candidatus Levybacteria bacterium RIFCSPLOWO2_12_FULL_39_17]|nr:MAG: hypothetical protein UT20_C0029G0031 [Candidatus Levybacteria bacterium GW2011_GWA1_39_11]OGH47779.1 MAG: hypothetical protein A3G66_04535 [Candidatus Levybacteria bacterium RIFCSPLOWO2_12_FULL_39_17]
MPRVESQTIDIHSYAPSDVAEAVRTRRERKTASSDIALAGGRGRKLQMIQDRVELTAGIMENLHAQWIEKKVDSLSDYFSKANGEDLDNDLNNKTKSIGDWRIAIKEAYWDGLSMTVTQEYRLSKKEILSAAKANLEDYDYIQDLITSYTFDFYRTLRVCERLNVDPGTALRLAKLAYHHNPNILISLSQKYPDMGVRIIKHAVVHNSSDPEDFLRRVKENI